MERRRRRAGFALVPIQSQRARERLQPVLGDADGVQSRHRRLAAQLHDLQLSHHGIPLRHLRQPEDAIHHGEQGIVADLFFDIFADQERRGFPTGQELGEAVEERLHLHFAHIAARLAGQGAKRIQHHDAGVGGRDLRDDLLQHRVQILLQHHVGQVDEADGLAQFGFVEEGKLLLIAQHLEGGFAEHGEVERRFLRRRIGEGDLMRQRGLAATGRAGQDVEGEFRNAAAEDLVEPPHAGRKLVNRDPGPIAHAFFRQGGFRQDPFRRAGFRRRELGCRLFLLFHVVSPFPKSTSSVESCGQISPTRRDVKLGPMKATSNPSN